MSGDMRYLFRFRDLVAKTIESHQAVISKESSCWWGWWKRPSEDTRADVWNALSTASMDHPISVGLFDSGHGKVYCASVTGIIPPAEDGGLVEGPSDKELIPLYYRESPFSRAWLRMNKIELIPSFFKNYSFAAKPNLPKYRKELLQRFVDKRIVDMSELTGMDTTIWEIRRSRPQDGSDEIILSNQALSAAVTGDVVRLGSNRILHITDLHFGTAASREQHVWRLESEVDRTENTLSTALQSALGREPVGGIIVTGDLTFSGSVDEYSEASSSLNKLLGLLDLDADRLIVVPGNHDIRWSTADTYTSGAPINSAPNEAYKNYQNFYRALFRHDPSPHLAMGRRWLLPSGLTLEVGALNSSSLSTGKNFLAGIGRIDEASFEEVREGLGWRNIRGLPEPTLALRVLTLHHHLTVTEDIESADGYAQGYGMAVDAVRIQRLAAGHRVQLALHGHKHRAFLWRSSVYDLPEHASPNYKLGEISIVGGGSAGSKETDGENNFFNLLEFRPTGLEITIYRAKNKGSFMFMKSFNAPFSRLEDGSIKLEDWIFLK